MRRVLIVSTAILVLFATSAVMAGEQQVSDRLLEILKERQIISENEFAELSDVADQMEVDQTAVDQRLEALDSSISEYLAKEGDEAGVATKHKKGTGFGFATGNFELWVGGLFQFEYYGLDVEFGQDTNNFRVKEARFEFKGKAFVEGFTYKFQFNGSGAVTLLDAYGNYVIAEGIQVRFGQFKVPYSRQYLTSAGALELMDRSIVVNAFAPGRDIGIMLHDIVALGEGDDMALEWAFGVFNGDGTNVGGNDNNWLGWAIRLGFYPMGMVEYSEGDLANTQDVKVGIAGSYVSVHNRPAITGGRTVKTDGFQFDVVVAWSGLYVEGEWHYNKVKTDGVSTIKNQGWFIQAGFVIPDSEFEVIGRYSSISWDSITDLKSTYAWQIGVAWYPGQEGHPFKALISFGQAKTKYRSSAASGSPSYPDDKMEPSFDIVDVVGEYGDTYFLRLAFQLDW